MTAVDLDDMISHDAVLETYPWISGHILNKWRRDGLIRAFMGKASMVMYPKQDLNAALTDELNRSVAQTGDSVAVAKPICVTTTTRDTVMSEADQIREQLFLERLESKRR
ncbi:hypothetical protein M8R20_16615 [Pseudomonas sp. R2.Fl]|nr:hypothetical protein [Pseudomonas sp. R2.Fl]